MNNFYIIVTIALGFLLIWYNKRILSKKDTKTLNILWIYHLIISVYYYFFTRDGGGDAWGYWQSAADMDREQFLSGLLNIFNEQGTYYMNTLNYIFANILSMDFLSNTLVYSLLGFIGIFFFYIICIEYIPYNSKLYKFRLFPLLFFLPSLHFWSSGIGKDTLSFLCIAMFAYGILKIEKRFPLIIIALLFSFGIRPHITLILLLSFGIAYLPMSITSKLQQIFIPILLLAVAFYILPKAFDFAKIEDITVDDFMEFSDRQAEGLSYGQSFVDISNYSYPFKVFTFLYRPFFFDINGIPALVASFENLLLLLLTIQVFRSKPLQSFRKAPLVIQGLFLFSTFGVFFFSMSMSNLGIILRMRNMFLPGMLLFMLWSLSYKRELVLKKRRVIRIPVFIEEIIKQVEEKFPKPVFQPSLPSYDQPITEIAAIKQDESDITVDTKAEEIVPIEAEEVIPTAVEEVVPIEVGEIIPAEPAEIAPAETDETIPADTGEIVPIEDEVVTPIESEEVIPAESEEIIPSEIEENVPAVVEEVIPTEVEEIVPEETVEVVPTVVEEIIPTVAGVIITGNIYHVEHPRKGSFDIQITSITDDCVKGIITNGFASNLSGKPSTEGDKVTLNIQACVFSSGGSIFVPVFTKEKEKDKIIEKEKETEVKKQVESVPSGKTDAGGIIEGNIYHVEHPRKGSFDIKITSLNDETVKGIITNGFATNLSGKPSTVGDKVTLNRQSCVFSKEKAT